MGKIQISSPNTIIMVAAVAAIIIISLTFTYLFNSHKADSKQVIDSYLSTIKELEQRLTGERKTRVRAETELLELQSMDWQTKYEEAKSENSMLIENTAAKEWHYGIELSRLNRAVEFLGAQNDALNDNLRDTWKSLEEFEDTYAVDIETWQENNHLLNEQLKIAELKNNSYLKKIEKLEADIKHLDVAKSVKGDSDSIKPDPDIKQASDTQKISVELDKQGLYRQVRLQSLHNAMQNQDSVTRSKILVSVIPSIPNGISGGELLDLLVTMNSDDVLNVIIAVNQYIRQPLDSQIVNALTSGMNQNDAETAELLLFGNQQ